jgi:hypothetical protein
MARRSLHLSNIEDRFTCTACGKRGADTAAGFQLEKDSGGRGGGYR